MKVPKSVFRGLVVWYAMMWLGAVGAYLLTGAAPPGASWGSPVFLLLAGIITFISTDKSDRWKLGLIASIGFAAEAVGVNFGFLFSPYQYTSVLQPLVLDVPVVMTCAWVVLIAYIRQMMLRHSLPKWIEIVVASAWMTAIDLVIDPLAANQLHYWQWQQSGTYYGIPAHNFAGWFVVSVLIFTLIQKPWKENLTARWLGLSIVLFFTMISIAFNLKLAAAIGFALCAVHFLAAELKLHSVQERHLHTDNVTPTKSGC